MDWEPREQLSSLEYVLFVLGFWISVERVPKWVTAAHCRWYQDFRQTHDRSYFGAKEFHGNGCSYRIEHVPQGTKCREDLRYAVKVSGWDGIESDQEVVESATRSEHQHT